MSRHELAEVGNYDDLLAAFRARADELSISRLSIDDLAGLCTGYSAKILGPGQIRGITSRTLGPLLEVLGLKLVVVEDLDAVAKHASRRTERRDDCVRYRKPITSSTTPDSFSPTVRRPSA